MSAEKTASARLELGDPVIITIQGVDLSAVIAGISLGSDTWRTPRYEVEIPTSEHSTISLYLPQPGVSLRRRYAAGSPVGAS